METNEAGKLSTKTKAPKMKIDRLAVKAETLIRLDGWLEQVEKTFAGIKLRRSDLVDWLINSQENSLSADSIGNIGALFYDDVQLMKWALEQAKEAKRNQKHFSIADILQKTKPWKEVHS